MVPPPATYEPAVRPRDPAPGPAPHPPDEVDGPDGPDEPGTNKPGKPNKPGTNKPGKVPTVIVHPPRPAKPVKPAKPSTPVKDDINPRPGPPAQQTHPQDDDKWANKPPYSGVETHGNPAKPAKPVAGPPKSPLPVAQGKHTSEGQQQGLATPEQPPAHPQQAPALPAQTAPAAVKPSGGDDDHPDPGEGSTGNGPADLAVAAPAVPAQPERKPSVGPGQNKGRPARG